MKSPPPISLLIPCYQAERFLPRLMRSVRAQTRPFAEIVAYDDGSTDHTVAIAEDLGITVYEGGENRGVSHARNQLAAAARCEWIHFHDPDDELSPQFLERLAPECDARRDVVTCDADWIDEDTGQLEIAWRYDTAALASDPVASLVERPMSLNNALINRDRWLVVGGCDEALDRWEDADVTLRLALDGATFFHVPEVLTHAHRRKDSLSADPVSNSRSRLAYLQKLADHPRLVRLRPQLAVQAERTAVDLLDQGDARSAAVAARLAQHLGARLPSSSRGVWSLVRPWVPGFTLLRLQSWIRRNRSRAAPPPRSTRSTSSP